jgi:hypothetical protein
MSQLAELGSYQASGTTVNIVACNALVDPRSALAADWWTVDGQGQVQLTWIPSTTRRLTTATAAMLTSAAQTAKLELSAPSSVQHAEKPAANEDVVDVCCTMYIVDSQ